MLGRPRTESFVEAVRPNQVKVEVEMSDKVQGLEGEGEVEEIHQETAQERLQSWLQQREVCTLHRNNGHCWLKSGLSGGKGHCMVC